MPEEDGKDVESDGNVVRAPLALRLDKSAAASDGLKVVVSGGNVKVGVTGTVTVMVTTWATP